MKQKLQAETELFISDFDIIFFIRGKKNSL